MNKMDEFEDLDVIGRGGFGTVYKVAHKLDAKVYAIKIINLLAISDEHKHQVIKEIKRLAKVRSQYVILYHNSWLDDNSTRLYIQMEYCPQSLRSVLADKALAFGRQSAAEPMNTHEYYISCEIFKELLECVQYLHALRPQIIHRKLKPENVLIVNEIINYIDDNYRGQRFIKLGDFGLANVYLYAHHPYPIKYEAPEVHHDQMYSRKSDTFALAAIGTDLFDLNPCVMTVDAYPDDHVLNGPVVRLHRMLQSMMSYPYWEQRPECRQVLAECDDWSIDKP